MNVIDSNNSERDAGGKPLTLFLIPLLPLGFQTSYRHGSRKCSRAGTPVRSFSGSADRSNRLPDDEKPAGSPKSSARTTPATENRLSHPSNRAPDRRPCRRNGRRRNVQARCSAKAERLSDPNPRKCRERRPKAAQPEREVCPNRPPARRWRIKTYQTSQASLRLLWRVPSVAWVPRPSHPSCASSAKDQEGQAESAADP